MYPSLEPFDRGWLVRPDGAELYWETAGNPKGRPALYLHGGPGGSLGKGGYRRRFDPAKYFIIGLDQRGCGRSRPLTIDSPDTLALNTTQSLIRDLEALREHFDVAGWLLHGVSWGSTLALAYALEHPEKVTELVLTAVTTGSREEIDWITEGVGILFPEAWEKFASVRRGDERVVEAYARLLRDPDPDVQSAAAAAWDSWESTHISLDPNWTPGPLHEDLRARKNFATLVTHYWSNECFLQGDQRILDRLEELDGIPTVLIHGRHDVSGPVITPWRLHKAMTQSRLIVVETEGHGGAEEMELTTAATDEFAAH